MTGKRDPLLADYWAARPRTAFWPTRELSYRLGAVLAFGLGKLQATPNVVSLLSLLTAVSGLCGALWLLPFGLMQAVVIFVVLNLSYALDCADGLIARVHGSGSRFGAFFDKFIDVLVLSATVGALGSMAGEGQSQLVSLPPELGVAFALGVRLGLCVLMWLREFEGGLPDRREEDLRERNFGFYARKGIGILCDQVFFITVISMSWAMGVFWDAVWIYHCLLALFAAGYLAKLYREEEGSE